MDTKRQCYLASYWESHLRLIEEMIAPYRHAGAVLLDAGCGRARNAGRFAGGFARYIGLNIDEEELRDARANNPGERFTFVHGNAMDMSAIGEGSVDLVLLVFVLEHIEHPRLLFAELARIVKPGGAVFFLAPNLLTGASLFIRSVPPPVRRALKRLLSGKDEVDDYPTFYRLNTVAAIDRLAERFGFERDRLEMRSGIGYLFHLPGFFLWHRLLERLSSLGPLYRLKGFIFATYRKAG